MPPGAADALKEAENSIGNRILKTQPDYVASAGHNTQLKVCLARKEIYDNKHEFNEKVVKLREHKVRLVARMKEIEERLGEIRAEMPLKLAKPPPPIPHIDDDLEFPEKNLEIKPEITSVRMAATRKTQERRVSLLYPQARTRQPRVPRFVPISESKPQIASWELIKPKQDQESSSIEIEIRERRIKRDLYEQDMLLVDAEKSIQDFDAQLRLMQRERVRVQERNQLLELHLYQLHREMNVLNRFEAHEDRLAERVYDKLMQVRGVEEIISDCEQRIEEHRTEKEGLDAACMDLQRQFKKLVQDNKFADFLRRIFKKKYRPPREHDDDESTESESSSSSEEEEEGSLDSRDIGPIRLDPNVCPEGCDFDVYNKTYELRNIRHKHEQEMIEKDHLVEVLRKDIEAQNKVKKKFLVQLDQRKNELKQFMMEKQSCMNEVDQVVILRYDQIRASALRECTEHRGVSEVVVFPERTLLRLRTRVLELQDEIKQQKQRRKINRTHVFRMKVDMKAMEESARSLRAAMREVLMRKLGYKQGRAELADRTLDDLLRQLARRHKFRAALHSLPALRKQLQEWRKRQSELEKKYLNVLNSYSERLRLAAALQAEVVPQKALKDVTVMVGGYEPHRYLRDIVRYRIVLAQQREQIQALEEEIQSLRLKPLSHVILPQRAVPPEPVDSKIYLQTIKAPTPNYRRKYFPITPLGSQVQLVYDVNIMKLLYDCLDAMRVSRDDAGELMRELTTLLPTVISGTKSRFEIVDTLVRKWLLRYGGDPSLYKKQTRAFDALARLADKLIRQHVETMEGTDEKSHLVMNTMEESLKELAGERQPLHERLGPALATVLHTTQTADLASEEAMTSLVYSLIDNEEPLTAESFDKINVFDVIEDIKDLGILAAEEDLKSIVELAITCIHAQLISNDERNQLDVEVEDAFRVDISLMATRKDSRKEPSTVDGAEADDNDRDGNGDGNEDD